MIYMNNKFVALRMVIKPTKRFTDSNGTARKDKGKYIQFIDGKFETEDKEEIAFIENYMKNHQGEIIVIDKKELKRQELANAKKIIAKAEKEDTYGKEHGISEIDTGQPNDETRDDPEQASEFMNMSLKEMQKKAKKMKLDITKEEFSDQKILKIKLIKALKEKQMPNLEDESDESIA